MSGMGIKHAQRSDSNHASVRIADSFGRVDAFTASQAAIGQGENKHGATVPREHGDMPTDGRAAE